AQLALDIGHDMWLEGKSVKPVLSFSSPSITDCRSRRYRQLAVTMIAEQMLGEIRYDAQHCARCLAMRSVSHARHERHIDRAIAFLLRHLDLPDSAVLIVLALRNQHRHPDIGEHVRDVPASEIRIEPALV